MRATISHQVLISHMRAMGICLMHCWCARESERQSCLTDTVRRQIFSLLLFWASVLYL